MTAPLDLNTIIARGDIVAFRELIKKMPGRALTILTGRVAKQPALSAALWNEITTRTKEP